MQQHLKLFRALQPVLQKVSVVRVPRSQNRHVNSLATLASLSDEGVPQMISMELLERPSIEHPMVFVLASMPGPSWMDPYLSFLSNRSLLNDPKELEKLRRKSSCFWLSKGNKLYRRLFGGPYLLCLPLDKVTELMTELHERGMWRTFERKESSSPSYDTRLLVAEHAERRS